MQRLLYFICLPLFIACKEVPKDAQFLIVKDGNAKASIVLAANPSQAATLAALELQHHIQLISGVSIPILSDREQVEGNKILIGDNFFARKLGYHPDAYASQEYSISFHGNNLVLYGKDWYSDDSTEKETGVDIMQVSLQDSRRLIDYNLATYQQRKEKKMIRLPGPYDDQASLYAVYDFMERALGVRWYGPADFNIIIKKQKNISLKPFAIHRSPGLKYREGTGLSGPMISVQYGNANEDAVQLFHRRMRRGGEKWGANHSFTSYQDRFLKPNPAAPELFEKEHDEYFALGRGGNGYERQFCYSSQALINQVVADARSYFDGHGLKGRQIAIGDYFAVLPLDNGRWCLCDKCQESQDRDTLHFNHEHFSSGIASNYIFKFINAIADSIARTNPGKKIATLAYHEYSYYPDAVKVRDNVSVSPCLHSRHYMSPEIKRQELGWYKEWVKKSKAPLYVWNYNTFPTERGVLGIGALDHKTPWHVFPGFSAHQQAELIRMYHEDGVRGVFLCGVGEQLDYYLAMKQYDDSSLQVDDLLDEFFRLYFGNAAEAMQNFYSKIEAVYNDFSRYPKRVKGEKHYHQDEEIAWKYLGTEAVMAELQKDINQAKAAKLSPSELRRVESWEDGIWNYMKQGREQYLKNKL